MKNLFVTLLAGALLATGTLSISNARAQGETKTPQRAFAEARNTWKEVRDNNSYLDTLVARKKLSEVHEAVFNLRDSVRMLHSAGAALPLSAQAALKKNIAELDVLANAMDASGDKNDLRGTILNQRQIHLGLDRIAALFPHGTLAPVGAIQLSGPVKDPVCRMTVDPATAPQKVAFSGQTYYFCSKGDAATFATAPAKYAALYEKIAFGQPKTFTVSLATDGPARAGKPELLTFAVREQGKSTPVRDFQLVHEKKMHLIVVSDDLSYFAHDHPEIGKDGLFHLRWRFPRAGRYFLFSDFTPGDGLNQILRTQLTVDGAQPKALPRLVPDTSLSKMVKGYKISLQPGAKLQAGKPVLLTYTLSRGGRPVTDMDLYLGANGHLMAINQNGRDIVHTHTIAVGGAVSPAMATAHGPRFTYQVTLPVPGLTKIWAQFQRGNEILTVPFTFNVQENQTMKNNLKTAAVVAATAATMGSAMAAPQTAQKVTISLPQGYKTGAATVKAGKPVALTFLLKSEAGCGDTVSVPAAKWSKKLKVGQSATLLYTPKKSGPLAFACGMGMYKGTLTVK